MTEMVTIALISSGVGLLVISIGGWLYIRIVQIRLRADDERWRKEQKLRIMEEKRDSRACLFSRMTAFMDREIELRERQEEEQSLTDLTPEAIIT